MVGWVVAVAAIVGGVTGLAVGVVRRASDHGHRVVVVPTANTPRPSGDDLLAGRTMYSKSDENGGVRLFIDAVTWDDFEQWEAETAASRTEPIE